ncbi:MAG: flippase activity-associated protein Agl23, partial [Blastocatellia bacterium]
DEGVNSYFLLNLARHHEYKYDPTNYHGPTLYYFARLAMVFFGETDLALRFMPALFGVMTVLMVWLLRKRLGPIGTPVAAFLMALSPGLVYFSRDFIHEMSFGCFSLGVVVGAWRYAESKNFIWLALTSTSAGLLFATKETAIITVVVLIFAAVCAAIWDIALRLIMRREFTLAALAREFARDGAAVTPSLDHLLASITIFVFIHALFYVSFFTPQTLDDGSKGIYWKGVTNAVKSIALWTGRSGSEHVKGFWYYFGILFKLELPLLIGSSLAGIFVLWRGTRFWLFVAAWTLGLTLAYSIIGYKTPWLMISFLIPMAILSGYAAGQIYGAMPFFFLRILWALALVAALTFNGLLAWRVNFDKHDDNSNSSGYFTAAGRKLELRPYIDGLYGYVYAQTDRGALQLVQAIKNEAGKLPSRNHTPIYVASPDYWPLPWYLRDYDQVAYTGSLPASAGGPPQFSQPIIIASVSQQSELDGLPGWRALPQAFTLRPGVELVIYVRDEAQQQ